MITYMASVKISSQKIRCRKNMFTCPEDASQILEIDPSFVQLHFLQSGYPKYWFLMSQLKLYNCIKR